MKKRLHIVFMTAFALALVAAFALVGCSSGASSASSASATSSASSAAASSEAASSAAASSETASSAAASTEAASASAASSTASADAVQLQVFAANSLEKALPEVQALYTAANPNVTFADTQFKASGDLVTQLEADSDAADLLIAASTSSMDKAVANGSIDEATRVDMFVNDLVLCAKEGSDLKVTDLKDLAGDSVKSFALGEPSVVPAGDYAAQSLASAGLIEYDADNKTITSWTDSAVEAKANTGADKVGTVASYVSEGQADLGFVYSSDIYRYDGIEAVYTVPADAHKAIKYPGAVTKDAKQAAAAADFLDFCLNNADAQAVFAKYGFELA